jgi:reactive intermediate/imine deaminase
MSRQIIQTPKAPQAIGPYSQAVRTGKTVYLSGQIALDPDSGQLVDGGIDAQVHRVFRNLKAVAQAADASLADAVRLTIYLTDLADFPRVNEIMAQYCQEPYPARATLGVAALPRGARVEIDAILVVD